MQCSCEKPAQSAADVTPARGALSKEEREFLTRQMIAWRFALCVAIQRVAITAAAISGSSTRVTIGIGARCVLGCTRRALRKQEGQRPLSYSNFRRSSSSEIHFRFNGVRCQRSGCQRWRMTSFRSQLSSTRRSWKRLRMRSSFSKAASRSSASC